MKLAADDVQTLVIPGCGHHPPEEAPEETLAALTTFLAPYRDEQTATYSPWPAGACGLTRARSWAGTVLTVKEALIAIDLWPRRTRAAPSRGAPTSGSVPPAIQPWRRPAGACYRRCSASAIPARIQGSLNSIPAS